MTREELIVKLHAIVEQAGSLRQAGSWLNISASHLCRVLNGEKRPGKKLLSAMGLEEDRRIYRTQRKIKTGVGE